MIHFRGIDPGKLDLIWEEVEPLMEDVVGYSQGEMTVDTLYEAIRDKMMQLMIAVEGQKIAAISITEVNTYPSRKKVLRVVGLAGSGFDEWGVEYVQLLRNWALQLGTDTVQLTGRKGWERKLRKLGWATTSINMEMKADG